MPRPALWQDDPPCGHEVACAFQTHYCTYIRAPRLLTLQPAGPPEGTLLTLSLQAVELSAAVLRRASLAQ
ncbi:MAG: hypothetical protein HY784_05345 [Chloroflexi bacterium]|nr:hypothetical protein [Chloroflexota bacterium]